MSSVGLQPEKEAYSRPAASFPVPYALSCLYVLLLLVLSIGLYYPVKTHPFVNYDDNIYVTENLHVQNGLTWDTVRWAFATREGGNWHPVTWLSHALDCQLFDLEPAGHHETNMLLHALNAVLLFWVLLRATGYAGRSFMVAALFAVHPINVESVVWVAERKTVLSMTFFLLALGAYRWYVSKPKVGRYAAVAALFALGLMAKPQIITFPCVLLLWDYWPLGRMAVPGSWSQAPPATTFPQKTILALLVEKLPLFGIAAASALMTMGAQSGAGAVLSLKGLPLSMRVSNAIVSYVKYIAKALWPAKLAPMYPHPGPWLPSWQIYGGLLLLVAMTIVVTDRRARRYLLVGWLWFLGTLVPMIGLVQVGRQAMADRYAYVPLLGIFIMLCWGIADWAQRKHVPAAVLPVASAVAILALALVAHRQIAYWGDNLLLWTHTVEVTAPNYIAEDNLGSILLRRKQPEDAIVHYRRAAELHPTDPVSAFSIAMYEQDRGELGQAIEHYKQSITLTTSTAVKAKAYENMGIAYRDLGEAAKAQECFATAQKLQP